MNADENVVELDGLGNSEAVAGSSPAGPVKVADLARAATSWLLKECKASKNTGRVRCQKWAEKLNDQVSEALPVQSATSSRLSGFLWTPAYCLSVAQARR